jgi:hypothetical protein
MIHKHLISERVITFNVIIITRTRKNILFQLVNDTTIARIGCILSVAMLFQFYLKR